MRVLPRFVSVLLMALAIGACTAPSGSGVPPTETPIWFAGDSIAHLTAVNMATRPYPAAVGGSGFTSDAMTDITDNTVRQLDHHGSTPDLILVLGGVNDLAHGATLQETIDGFVAFESAMDARGIPVRPVLSPWYTVNAVDGFNQWISTNRPNAIDCLGSAGGTTDGVHPANYGNFSACVVAAL